MRSVLPPNRYVPYPTSRRADLPCAHSRQDLNISKQHLATGSLSVGIQCPTKRPVITTSNDALPRQPDLAMTPDAASRQLKARIVELETTLAQSVSEWTETVDALSDWVCIIDPDFRILRTNLAVESFLGLKREDVLGKTCYQIVHGSDTHIAECPVPKMVKSLKRAQTEFQMGDGRWLSVTVDPLTDKGGRLTGAVHMARDITALRGIQAEREALIQDLKKALSEVKTLKGLIPICARCRRIRDDNGAWSSLETYVRNNLDTDFSHGLCPDCIQKLYPDFYEEGEDS